MKCQLMMLASLFGLNAPAPHPKQVEIDSIFQSAFTDHYIPNRCQLNVANLAQKLKTQGVDLSDTFAVVIKNEGFSSFGTLPVFHARTFSGEDTFANHHVFLLKKNQVYDLDYGHHPQSPDLKTYLHQMFTNEKIRESEKRCLSYIGDYELSFYLADDFIKTYLTDPKSKLTPQSVVRIKNASDWSCKEIMELILQK